MKYINQLTDDEITNLVKIWYEEDDFDSIKHIYKKENSIDIYVYIKSLSSSGRKTTFVDRIIFQDYDVRYRGRKPFDECIAKHQNWMINRFGEEYIIDAAIPKQKTKTK